MTRTIGFALDKSESQDSSQDDSGCHNPCDGAEPNGTDKLSAPFSLFVDFMMVLSMQVEICPGEGRVNSGLQLVNHGAEVVQLLPEHVEQFVRRDGLVPLRTPGEHGLVEAGLVHLTVILRYTV